MLKHKPLGFLLFIITAIVIQACSPNVAVATPDSENEDPVVGAQKTLAAATQESLTALAIAQETIAAATLPELTATNPVSAPTLLISLPNDQHIEASSTGQVVCSQLEINLKNLSTTTTFKSTLISMSVKDDPSSITVTSSTNGFLGHNSLQTNTRENCQSPSLLPNLDPGASYTVLFPEFSEKEGSTLEGSIVLCTENDLGGQCSKNLIVFIPTVEENISFEAPEASLSPDIFKVDYVGVVHPSQCPETWWLRVNLTNKSTVTLKSMSISVTDTTTNENAQSTGNTNIFSDEDQSVCNPGVDISDAQGVPDLVANASFTVSSGKLTKDPTGHTLAVTIKLCTEENLTGECSEKTANFTPGITAVATVDTTKPTFPFIILSEGTNCRTGPGTEYSLIGAYTAETKIPVLGKDSTGRYWIVASPNVGEPNIKCWLIGDYVKESGNVNNVEIYPVPPTPTPRIPTSTPTTTLTSTPTSTSTP